MIKSFFISFSFLVNLCSRLLSSCLAEGDNALKGEGAQAAYQDMMASSSTAASFILMEGEQQGWATTFLT